MWRFFKIFSKSALVVSLHTICFLAGLSFSLRNEKSLLLVDSLMEAAGWEGCQNFRRRFRKTSLLKNLAIFGLEIERVLLLLGLKYNKLFRRDKSISLDFQSLIRRVIGES